jgi:hypothetical protein
MSIDFLIGNSYRKVPFHDWNHGRNVHTSLMKILWDNAKPHHHLWAKLHDAWHGYIAQHDDEKNAWIVSRTLLEKLWLPFSVISKVEFLIDGTIFRERGNLSDYDQIALADADISSVWWEYDSFLRSSAKLYIESLPVSKYPSKQWIIDFYKNQTLIWFMWFLTKVSWNQENPFLIPSNAKLFPNFSRNRDKLLSDLENNQNLLISTVKKEWRKFYKRSLVLLEDINS